MTSSRTWGIVEEPTGASRGIRVVAEELSGDSVQKFKWGFVATPACRAERWARLVRPAFVGGSRSCCITKLWQGGRQIATLSANAGGTV